MAVGFNKIILIGRLTRDPEVRYTPAGVPVAHFTLAVDRSRSSSKENETDFIDIVAWQKLAEICQQYLGKGRLVAIDGRLQIRNYEAKDGQKRKAVEVVASDMKILDSKPQKSESGSDSNSHTGTQNSGAQTGAGELEEEAVIQDDMPF
ncbi:MAG: single-stranded DNA-binding protein [Candidatus Eremiobacteraeota bacterium]|nr:single-stranded DNA-binding protein [Candidatus Eremiobacteraeota bacterium]